MADSFPLPTRPRQTWSRARFTIGRLMVVVAVAACLAACYRIPEVGEIVTATTIVLAAVTMAFLLPAGLDRPGRRLLFARRVAALWPLSVPISLHVGWAIALGFLGRPLRPPDNGFWVETLSMTVFFFMLSSLILTAVVTPVLAVIAFEREDRSWSLAWLLLPLGWFASIAIMRWDPVGAVVWLMD